MFKCVYLEGSPAIREVDGLFGTSKKEDIRAYDGHDLARLVEEACNEFERNGFAIVSVTPKTDGQYSGYAGWSYTAGVLILARKEG